MTQPYAIYILAGLLAAPALWVILFFAMAMGE